MAKSKKKRQQDFQKVKLKVGKKLKKADNVTNASFKTRAIQISQQLKSADASQPSTRKKQNITDLFSQCRHYSTSVRLEAVNGLKELISAHPDIVPPHISDILERAAELLTDKESSVRQGVIRVFKVLLSLVSEKQVSPFFPLLCAHLCCAMTHIYDDIQVDSLVVLDLLLENYPRLIIYKSNQVLSNFIEQISRQQGQSHAKRSLSTNPNSATSSVKWRSSVLNRLQKFLAAILKYRGSSAENMFTVMSSDSFKTTCDVVFNPDEIISVQPFPAFIKDQWEMPGYMVSSSNTKDAVNKRGVLNGKFSEFADTLVPLMLECWVESAPSKDKNKDHGRGNLLSGENVGMMYNVLQVTQLLWDCSVVLSEEEDSESACTVKYLKEFEQHFMAGFPYSVNTRVSKKDKKSHSDNVQVSSEMLNLTICNIMTHFIVGISTNQGQRHIPAWLPLVTKYLSEFLRGKYGRAGVGQSARTVVTILKRLVARGFVDGQVLDIIDEMYSRFETANIASSEKRVYLKFFADTLLEEETKFISPDLRRKFLQILSELLPLCARENSEMASLVISTMKKAVCQRCADLLNRDVLSRAGQLWYDPQQGIITSLSAKDQQILVGLLYSVPDLGLELTRTLVSLARCPDLTDNMAAFMIQVLQNRFLRSDQTPEEATVHISFLTNLLVGVTRAEIESLSEEAGHTVLGSYRINKQSFLEGDNTTAFDRHCFHVEVVGSAVQQFYNTDEVVEVMFQFVEKMLKQSSSVPLQLAFGVCKFAESLTNIPSGFVFFLNNLCISLVNHLIMWKHSTNQSVVCIMLDLGCSLLMKTTGGVETLVTIATEYLQKELSVEILMLILKTVMLFVTEDKQQCIKNSPGCVLKLETFHTSLQCCLSESQNLVTKETERLFSNLSYLISCVK